MKAIHYKLFLKKLIPWQGIVAFRYAICDEEKPLGIVMFTKYWNPYSIA